MIYKALWLLLQICFTIIDTLRQICYRSQSILKSYDQRLNGNRCEEKNLLQNCSAKLSKLPSHLSIVIGPEETSLDEKHVLQLINYASWMNINFISLYDTRTEKRRCNLLNMELPKHLRIKQLENTQLPFTLDQQLKGKNIFFDNGYTNGYKNGTKSDRIIQLFEVKPFQGHNVIAEVCRELFKQRQSYEIKDFSERRTLLTRHLDEELSARLWKCKDPELCIVFSKHMSTFGMLPWQMRFTEFYLHEKGSCFDARTFAKILFQYARCEQRWGK